MYDTQKIYDNVIRHGTLSDGTKIIYAPDGFGLGYKQVNSECITLSGSYRENKKHSQVAFWYFTITKEGITLEIFKKHPDSGLILAIAESYNRLIKLIEPYEDGEAV